MSSEFILDSRSPVCELFATVEKSDDAYYFYIMEGSETDVPKMQRILWICNRKTAPQELDLEAMRYGAPMMPEQHVGHAPEGMELNEEDLEIVWFADGVSAALLEKSEILAVIPPYSGINDFPGYSRYAKGQHRYGWELPKDLNGLAARINEGAHQWISLAGDTFWQKYEQGFQQSYGAFLKIDKPLHYYILDNDRPPHKRLLIAEKDNAVYDLTIGMSQLEMPGIQRDLGPGEGFRAFARMELGFAALDEMRSAAEEFMPKVIEAVSNMPWREYTFLASGHIIDFTDIEGFSALLVADLSGVEGLELPVMPVLQDCHVRLNWLIPITEEEIEFLHKNGTERLLRKAASPKTMHIFDMKPKFLR